MAIQRMTAKKVWISEIINGRWVKREGMEPSFVVTDPGEKVSRARVLGTIVQTFMAEDGNFGSVTLDDGTDTIRAKTFKTVKPLDAFKEGDNVDLIGKVREYNGEVYIIPEIVTRLQDPNMELMRRLELMKKARELKGRPPEVTPEEVQVPTGAQEAPASGEHPSVTQGSQGRRQAPTGTPQSTPSQKGRKGDTEKESPKKEDNSELRKEILKVIESEPDGVEYKVIVEKVKAEEAKVESVLNEILAEGICYEPTPGKVKKI